MKKSKNGFVVSAVLYPLLVLFLAIIMGLLSMTDTRKRILDKMKLEIEDSILDDATCSCETILGKLNFIIDKLDKGITATGGGASGSYTFNVLTLRIKAYETVEQLPTRDVAIGDIAMISDTPVTDYYIATVPPNNPKEGSVWVVQDHQSNYYVKSDYSRIGISYVMQYLNGSWYLKKSYVYDDNRWILLYYVNVKNHDVDLTQTNINGVTEWTYGYKGEYQVFRSVFSGYYKFELWGAQGGTYSTAAGGLGAYTSGLIYLNAGETFYIYVGGTSTNNVGGWNGGGNGTNATYSRGGGGATDVRLVETTNKDAWNEFDSLKSRIMVAAGGGGGGTETNSTYSYGIAGAGGGIIGLTGSVTGSYNYTSNAVGATQSSTGHSNIGGGDGLFAKGGNGWGVNNGCPGGGGGGYYGGGGAYGNNDQIGATSGGSSYISGHIGVSSIDKSSTNIENILHNGSTVHYTGYFFKDTKMIDGTGHAWTQIRSSETEKQPNNAGTGLQTGQSGNGYAKITLQTIEYVSDAELEDYADRTFNEWHYTYAGETPVKGYYQEFTAKENGYYQAELWGAQGGSLHGYSGGLGAYTEGQIYLNKGQKLYIYVGIDGTGSQAGWNGGGKSSNWTYGGSGGGGATDIRLSVPADRTQWDDFDSIKTRIMIAAGGGGGSNETNSTYSYANGGAGGGLEGIAAGTPTGSYNYNFGGGGGKQTSPGFATQDINKTYSNYSSFAQGGHSYGVNNGSGGGGGGGYYGGGGGWGNNDILGGGGGGSSYISGHEGCSSIDEESLPTDVIHNGSAYHYSGYYFKNTKMIDGQGYIWYTNRNTQIYQPTWDGKSTQTGESGSGHARITLVEKVTKSDTEIAKKAQSDEHGWYYPYTYLNNSANAGKYQKFTSSKSGYYKIEMWGASGSTTLNAGGTAGLGAYTSGEIYLNENTSLYVFVGKTPDKYARNVGGWNGGGNGNNASYSGGGGGATDIRITPTASTTYWDGFDSLKSRIMIAAAGAGASTEVNSTYSYGVGAFGGGIQGFNGGDATGSYNYSTPGYGATQTSPGFTYAQPTNSSSLGTFGKGGNGYGVNNGCPGGGGAGYYGGAGSYGNNDQIGGAGSGSSYISGHTGCNSMTSDSTESNMIFTGSAYHSSGYYFTKTQMIDGGGYSWNSERNELVGQPLKFGTGTQTGNSGDGYVKITFIKEEVKTSSDLKSAQLTNENEWHYTYSGTTGTSGRYQTFTVPKNGYYSMALWGAQGGQGGWSHHYSSVGGLGGYTYGEIYLTKGTKLYLYIGNSMTNGSTSWNGGGTGGGYGGGSGGGSTDIRTVPNTYISVWNDTASLASRIMVAGAGGGGGNEINSTYSYASGGTAGGLIGYTGPGASGSYNYNNPGTGGTQISAGYRSNATTSNVGGLGYGGTGGGVNNGSGGGGGGGYYGGGGAYGNNDQLGGGGGGSSYISGHAGCIATTTAGLPLKQTYTTLADSVSNTNMKFTNTIMIDGAGKKWTTTVGSQLDYQPTYNGVSNKTGNSGVGHARIVYLGA